MKRMRISALALTLALVPSLCGWAQIAPAARTAPVESAAKAAAGKAPAAPAYVVSGIKQPAFRATADTITAAELKDYLTFVASDEMEGRQTPSRGLDTTARFLATELSRAGVKPGGRRRHVLPEDRAQEGEGPARGDGGGAGRDEVHVRQGLPRLGAVRLGERRHGVRGRRVVRQGEEHRRRTRGSTRRGRSSSSRRAACQPASRSRKRCRS